MSTDQSPRSVPPQPPSSPSHAPRTAAQGAPLVDRLLAFGFDLCLWSPAALWVGKPFWRDFHYHQSLSPGSNEAVMFFGFGLFAALVFFIAVQTLCVWWAGATPGKKIFLLEVARVDGGRLSLGQSFTRALTQVVELLCFAIPWLEVVSHPERRPWHDRLAESRVVTRKPKAFEAPHPLETRFFRNLYWGFGLSLFVFAFAGLIQLRHQVKLGALKRPELERNAYLCETKTKIPGHGGMTSAQARLDFMLAQFEAGAADRDCLEAEADFAVWTQAEEVLPWAHLIRGVLAAKAGADTSGEGPAAQFEQACPANDDVALASSRPADEKLRCELVRYYQGDEQATLSDRSWTGQVLQLKQVLQRGDFAEVGVLAVKSPWPLELADFVQETELRALALQGAESEFHAGMRLLAPAWTETKRFGAMAWACFAAITRSCVAGGESPAVCRALRTELETAEADAWTPGIALTFQLESRCHNRRDVVAENRAQALLSAVDETRWALEPAKAGLKELKDLPQDHWSRPYLLWWVSRQRKNAGDELALEFQRGSRSEPGWWLAYRALDRDADADTRFHHERALSAVRKEIPQRVPVEGVKPDARSANPQGRRPASGSVDPRSAGGGDE